MFKPKYLRDFHPCHDFLLKKKLNDELYFSCVINGEDTEKY